MYTHAVRGYLQRVVRAGYVFAIGAMLLNIMSLPTLLSESSVVPLTTSLTFMVVLMAFSVSYWYLKMPMAAVSQVIGSLIWLAIAVVRHP